VLVRPATLADAEAIRSIYNVEVVDSTVTFDLVPRTLDEQHAWQRARAGALSVVVAEEEGQVVGFGSLSAYRDRPGYRTSVEDSVYVDRGARGRGVGDAVLARLVSDARAHGFHAVFARIVGGHHASIALHRKHGFRVVGTEREVGRKFGRWLDVVLMQRLLGEGRPRAQEPPPRHPAEVFAVAVQQVGVSERRALLEQCLAPEVRYCDPGVAEPVSGIGELDHLIASGRADAAGPGLELGGTIDAHHDLWRVRWRRAGASGTMSGEVDPDGRILRLDVFSDRDLV
jgi:phosphinothricin acetyltransferase